MKRSNLSRGNLLNHCFGQLDFLQQPSLHSLFDDISELFLEFYLCPLTWIVIHLLEEQSGGHLGTCVFKTKG